MSQFGLIYRMRWDTTDVVRSVQSINVASKNMVVNIYDTDVIIDDADTPTVLTLIPSMPPLTISVIDNNEDKFTAVRAKQAVIRFLTSSTTGLSMELFADAADNRFKVEVLADGVTLFLGFLVLPDIQQPFLPDPQVCELTATDQLGLLKDIPFTDDNGENPSGKYRIAEILATALKKTGLELDIKVVNNLRHGSGNIGPILSNFGVFSGVNSVTVSSAFFRYFYVGQSVTISGTANAGTYTVTAVNPFLVGLVLVVFSGSSFVTEEVNASYVDNSSGHLYDKIYLDALTFESNIGECEDCRTVIEKILGENCLLTQWKGAWWILRIAEINDNVMYVFTFDQDGVLQGGNDELDSSRNIGNPESICHADANTIMRFDRPNKFIRENFRYITPKELFCNIDMSRGDVITPPDLSLAESTGTYQLDCWTLRRISGSITSTVHVLRRFEYGYPKDKYAVITPKTGSATPWDFIESQPIEVRAKDKATVTIEWRFETAFSGGGSTYYPLRVYLLGDDGNWWYWWHPTSNNIEEFYWTNAGTAEAERLIPDSFDAGAVDETNWRTLSVDLAPIPVDGKLYIGLNQGHQGQNGGDNQNINYQGVQVDLKSFINGSYQLYTGHYNKVIRATGGAGYNATRDKEVFIGDSPRKSFKGSMFFLSGAVYMLSAQFYDASRVALGNPALTDVHPYGYIQAFDVWNQYKLSNRIFAASMYGLFAAAGTDWPDIMNKFALTDANPNTNDRWFTLVSMSQNWKDAKWNGVLIECFNRTVGYTETDTHEFKYLTQ